MQDMYQSYVYQPAHRARRVMMGLMMSVVLVAGGLTGLQAKAQNAGLQLAGSAVASDAFFPFRDGLDVVVAAGASAVIQPGGSMRDQEVIDAADEQGVVMALTGTRHFRH